MSNGKILVDKTQLNLKMMLEGGQCFRWRSLSENEWIGTVLNVVWQIKQLDHYIEYSIKGGSLSDSKVCTDSVSAPNSNSSHFHSSNLAQVTLSNYFRLEDPLEKYYEDWCSKDPNFTKVAEKCYGIRILNQDPVENVFSFICSSNNNIKRISGLVEKLCKMYGAKIGKIDGIDYFGFPSVSALAASEESDLRKAGFGYRAKFISQTAKQLHSLGGEKWLDDLKNKCYNDAKIELMKFPGIGAKVADCICLMSLGHMEALPVDTHVYQIARQTYMPHLRKVKNLTDRIYNEIGDFFRSLYGPLAGWAHTILFCGDLKAFKSLDVPSEQDITNLESKENILNGSVLQPTKKRPTLENESDCISGVLICSRKDLHLRITLNSGQTYRFREIDKDVWRGVFGSKVWTLNQFDDYIQYTCHFQTNFSSLKKRKLDQSTNEERESCEKLLRNYFRLEVPLAEHYKRWADSDKHFKSIANQFYGLRMIKQDIVENLFTFICSSNNTITRMTSMVEKMCTLYGEKIAEVNNEVYFDFPSVDKLAQPSVGEDLKKANFGFRAKYVHEAALRIMENGGETWFNNLKLMPYEDAKVELMKLPGIASKVADCICLTALDHLETIPVDTHVFQIAKRYYLPHLQDKKTVTQEAYKEIGLCFRRIFGYYSGWAHTVRSNKVSVEEVVAISL